MSPILCVDILLTPVGFAVMLTWITAFTVASNRRVPVPDMVRDLEEASNAPDTKTIYFVMRKVYLVGRIAIKSSASFVREHSEPYGYARPHR